MIVTKASASDKDQVLEFCQNTFSWGDYIADVWDSWIDEGDLLVIHKNSSPIAICHASTNKEGKQTWIEGIRVNQLFRRKGYASILIKEAENIAKKKNCTTAFMLIASSNVKSLALARKLDYEHYETWNFYSFSPKKIGQKIKIKFANYEKKLPSILFSSNFFFVNSWRWLPLDDFTISSLCKEKRIIYFGNDNITEGLAILTVSEHFGETMLITIISGSINGLKEILSYIQNYGYQEKYKRLQILTKLKHLPGNENFENRITFSLMKKKI
ncbi:MAG: N-acetyltransferase GCN5 [Nitrosopumilales archaeon]|nr:MAG: N-acetyltransferase GCN5 [Nitrosopumilales archaeon]